MLLFKFKKTIPNHVATPENAEWSTKLQLWVDSISKAPLVNRYRRSSSTNYGETVLTETNEGVDQSEIIAGTKFGETVVTNTIEGIDQSESSMGTEYGETILTKTHEGTDQSEGSQLFSDPISQEA